MILTTTVKLITFNTRKHYKHKGHYSCLFLIYILRRCLEVTLNIILTSHNVVDTTMRQCVCLCVCVCVFVSCVYVCVCACACAWVCMHARPYYILVWRHTNTLMTLSSISFVYSRKFGGFSPLRCSNSVERSNSDAAPMYISALTHLQTENYTLHHMHTYSMMHRDNL